jgi:DNA modification methylase
MKDFIKVREKPKKTKKSTKKISDTGKPRTWEWMGESQKFGLILNKRNPAHIEYVNDKAQIPAEDVDWWNSVWEFPDINWDSPTYAAAFRSVSFNDHPAQFIIPLVEQLIYRYSKKGDLILDPMAGAGNALITARYMKRHSIGVDLSPKYVDIMKTRCQFQSLVKDEYVPIIIQGDSMKLNEIPELSKDNIIDEIIFSPPYFDIKTYATEEDKNQIGDTHDFQEYLNFMEKILQQCYRVLKPGKFCCVVVSNVRKGKLIPVAWKLADVGEKVGFDLWDDIVHHTSHSMSKAVLRGGQWGNAIRLGHTVRTHETILVFKKPEAEK